MTTAAAAKTRSLLDAVEFRPAEEVDLQDLQELYLQLIPEESPTIADMRGALVQLQENPQTGVLVVGVLNGKVVATCQVIFYPNLVRAPRYKAEIDSVIVHESLRGQGIGGALMRWAMDWLDQRNCSKVIVATAYTREIAHKMYESLGYQQSGYGYIYSYSR